MSRDHFHEQLGQAKSLILERMRDIANEQGVAFEPERADNLHRLNMGVFPSGAGIIPNPFNKIPGFFCSVHGSGGVYFLPGFPVMAHPMMAWVLDTHFSELFARGAWIERSVIVFDAMESTLTPLMEAIEHDHVVKVFSLPSVDHPQYGRRIDLGVKGDAAQLDAAFDALLQGLNQIGASIGPLLVR